MFKEYLLAFAAADVLEVRSRPAPGGTHLSVIERAGRSVVLHGDLQFVWERGLDENLLVVPNDIASFCMAPFAANGLLVPILRWSMVSIW